MVKAQGYGVANVEWNAATTPETVFQAGSVGTQFTATLVMMMLVEEGKIGLDDPISKYIAGVPKNWKGITVRHLLTHTSGISTRLGDLLRERIFTPLGMSTARVISEADIVPHRAAGYRLLDGELKNQEWVSPSLNTTADGSLYMTVLDLAR